MAFKKPRRVFLTKLIDACVLHIKAESSLWKISLTVFRADAETEVLTQTGIMQFKHVCEALSPPGPPEEKVIDPRKT